MGNSTIIKLMNRYAKFEIDLPVKAVAKVNGDFISAHVFGAQYAYRFAHILFFFLQVGTILIIANSS